MNFDKMLKVSYWNNNSKYEKQYKILYDKLVPAQGRAKTIHGEVLRCMSKVYYDLFNNGGGNFDVLHKHFSYLENLSDDIMENSSWDVKMFDKFSKWIILMKKNDSIFKQKLLERMVDCVVEYCYFMEFNIRLDFE